MSIPVGAGHLLGEHGTRLAADEARAADAVAADVHERATVELRQGAGRSSGR